MPKPKKKTTKKKEHKVGIEWVDKMLARHSARWHRWGPMLINPQVTAIATVIGNDLALLLSDLITEAVETGTADGEYFVCGGPGRLAGRLWPLNKQEEMIQQLEDMELLWTERVKTSADPREDRTRITIPKQQIDMMVDDGFRAMGRSDL